MKLLYIIYMEPFLLAFAAVCTGVRVADFNQIDEDYCDDVEALVEDEEDIVKIERFFQRFEMVSGALLSRTNKSKVMGLGGLQGKNKCLIPGCRLWMSSRLLVFKSGPIMTTH